MYPISGDLPTLCRYVVIGSDLDCCEGKADGKHLGRMTANRQGLPLLQLASILLSSSNRTAQLDEPNGSS